MNEVTDEIRSRVNERVEQAAQLLLALMNRAYMRLSYDEADEIAEFLGIKKPTDHELEDLR